ncbi:MAG: ankyrin repeat domain-containing protein [Akkermansia sp.]|nr:ankyrin repeat domain-containing protein [Akkermansia sp.]
MAKTAIFSLLLITATAWAEPNVPTELTGRKIQFSYSPSWKFTPLLMHFGQSGPGNQYTLHGEDRSCNVTYSADTATGKARLLVNGKKDHAEIDMTFYTDTAGIAHMTWNKADYYDLSFRVEPDAPSLNHLSRMGDPVGDVMPPSLAGKVMEIDFSGAFHCLSDSETGKKQYQEVLAAPLVVQFPQSGDNFTCEAPALPGKDSASMTVTYSPIGCGATVSLTGNGLSAEIVLDFATSESGMAYVDWEMDNTHGTIRGAGFRLIPSKSAVGKVIFPTLSDANKAAANTQLAQLIQELEKKTYKTAVERLYQRRLLTLLQQIAEGASVNTILPNDNGTTALHNACGLSHVEIVQWLVNHGANLNAKTAKGAGVDDCVGGPNARAIRAILRKARNNKK